MNYEIMNAAGAAYEAQSVANGYNALHHGSHFIICSYTSISNFTLNLLEDSGWYQVDYATAATLTGNYELLWGKGELYTQLADYIRAHGYSA